MAHTIFALEVAARLDRAPALLPVLRSCIQEQGARVGLAHKWRLYRRACEALVAHAGFLERGCWDYFDDAKKAKKDFAMWLGGMTTEEGARTTPSGRADHYRGEPRYLTFTMALHLDHLSPSDVAVARLCAIPPSHLWRRDVFVRILEGLGAVSFASVHQDVMYLIPRDDDWGLTMQDLAHEKFAYLRPIVG